MRKKLFFSVQVIAKPDALRYLHLVCVFLHNSGVAMRFLKNIFRGISVEMPPFMANRSLAGRILLPGLPMLATVLIVVFFAAGKNVEKLVDHAISRNAQLRAQAISLSLEYILQETRNHLLVMAAGATEKDKILHTLKLRAQSDGLNYCEVAFMGLRPEDRFLLVNRDNEFVAAPPEIARDSPAGPFHNVNSRRSAGYVSVSRPTEVSYPLMQLNEDMRQDIHSIVFHVLRFSTPIYDETGQFKGILSLALDLGALRERLSIAGAMDGATNGGKPRSFFFDPDGWMMFQSEDITELQKPLNSDIVRAGFKGDYGRQGFSLAFRPAPEHLNYWTMISDIQEQKSGIINLPSAAPVFPAGSGQGATSYAPVTFRPHPDEPPQLVGGVALLDDNFIATEPGRQLIGIYGVAIAGGIFLLALCLWWVANGLGRPMNMLTAQLRRRNLEDEADSLSLPPLPRELENLRGEVDSLLARLRDARDMQLNHEAARARHRQRQPVSGLPPMAIKHASFFVGESRSMRILYDQIGKAALVSADVLVRGETGTGKELVAASIHRLSSRANGPFMSINCGALDEALLMDTLFGHVKGAFTEARTNRKGAFLAASGGTLLLDEIGNAPPKVQQALLRALSTRHIRPLGSDEDIAFDTRIIAATNSSLRDASGDFRNDLYFRLAVITIETPPLRNRKEDIPQLIVHFMAQTAAEYGNATDIPGISHGALEKLEAYDWPGNVRELKNVMTRAMAFCNGKLIMAEDLHITSGHEGFAGHERHNDALEDAHFSQATTVHGTSHPNSTTHVSQAMSDIPLPLAILDKLNQRQRNILPALLRKGSISRQEYQELSNENISSRTAQYDLKVMMSLGLLRREGRGPSQRYWTVEFPASGNAPA